MSRASKHSTELARLYIGYDNDKSVKDSIPGLPDVLPDNWDNYEIIDRTLEDTGIFKRAEENTGISYIDYFIAEEVSDYIISEFRHSLSAKDIQLRLNMSPETWDFFLTRFDEIKR
jgi:hypothetical protein